MSLFRLEFLRVCRSATYIAAVAALVLFAYFQQVFPPNARIAAAGEAAGEVEICVLPAEEYALVRDIDRFSGAHARLFASRVGGALAVLCPFPAAALFWHDRRACRVAIYARGISSLKLVLCRCAALTAAMLLPVTVMALTLTCVAAMDYGLAAIDLLAYGKYALLWLLPTILLATGLGALPTALTGLPLGPLLALLWGWTAKNGPAFDYAAQRPATRRWAGRPASLNTSARWRAAASSPPCWVWPSLSSRRSSWKRSGGERSVRANLEGKPPFTVALPHGSAAFLSAFCRNLKKV